MWSFSDFDQKNQKFWLEQAKDDFSECWSACDEKLIQQNIFFLKNFYAD